MAFNTLQVLKENILAVKSKVKDMPVPHDTVVVAARTFAYEAILSALVERGFTKAQVDQWRRGAEFELDLTLWWFFRSVVGANQGSYPAEINPKHWDRREELKTVAIMIGDELADAEGETRIGYGAMDDSSDRVRMDTRWS